MLSANVKKDTTDLGDPNPLLRKGAGSAFAIGGKALSSGTQS